MTNMPESAPQEFPTFDKRAVLKVCGIGGGGGNAVDRMIEAGLSGVQFIVINTDAQALKKSKADIRIQIGTKLSNGLGAGARPEIGRQACEEDLDRVGEVLTGADMVFLTVGLGGGTGTGAAPIVAKLASESGALTVAIVTLPFSFEGEERMKNALDGLKNLEEHVDTLIVVPNDRIAELSQNNTSFLDAFRYGDEVLHNGVRAISELITVPGLINLDFSDLRTIMQARGRALMGIGIAEGDDRAIRAATEAIICPLLEQSDIHGAKGVIVNVRGGSDIRMKEMQDAIQHVRSHASPDANIIFGAVVDKEERPEFQVTVIAAGFPRKDIEEYKRGAAGKPGINVAVRPAVAASAPVAAPLPVAPAVTPVAAPAAALSSAAPVVAASGTDAAVRPAAPAKPAATPAKPAGKEAAPAQQAQLPLSGPPAPDFRTEYKSDKHSSEEDDLRIPTWLRLRNKGKK